MKIVGMSHKEITYERKKQLAKSPKKKTSGRLLGLPKL